MSAYSRTIKLGKVDAQGKGKINAVEIEVEINDQDELSMMGAVWNRRHTDWISGGQNYEEIGQLFPDSIKVQRMIKVWERWHLNHMRAGTPAQEAWLRENGHGRDYEETCAKLAEAHLLVVGRTRSFRGYRYGTAWLKEELPAEVVAEVKSWQ